MFCVFSARDQLLKYYDKSSNPASGSAYTSNPHTLLRSRKKVLRYFPYVNADGKLHAVRHIDGDYWKYVLICYKRELEKKKKQNKIKISLLLSCAYAKTVRELLHRNAITISAAHGAKNKTQYDAKRCSRARCTHPSRQNTILINGKIFPTRAS